MVVAAAVFFCTVCLSSAATIKITTLVLIVLALIAGVMLIVKRRERIGLPLLILAAVVVMDGISTLYAVPGKFALGDFLKVISAFCVGLILLAIAPKGEKAGRWIAKILSGFSTIAGLVSIDLFSTRLFSGAVIGFLQLFTTDFENFGGLEVGTRMTSMFETPNVFAGIAGLGVLLSLGLVVSSKGKFERGAQTVILYINSLSFLLAFSMGASGSIAVAFAIILLLTQARERAGMFILMAETLLCTLVAAAIISMTSFGAWSGMQPVPMLCVILGAATLVCLDTLLGRKLGAKLENRGKLVVTLEVAVIALVAIFAVAAYNFTGSVNLTPGEALRRAAYPEPGAYALAVDSDSPLNVTIESQDQQETMQHTSTVLYSGAADGATFQVPEGSLVCYFNFYSPEGGEVRSVTYSSDAGSGDVPLGYRLLPGFMANRLQGLWANENAIQRFAFFSDGLKIFRSSPVFGLGMGAFEYGYRNIQSFAYVTRYAHNHYIQMLTETGIVGLTLFLLLLVASTAAIVLERRKGEAAHPLTPALGAALAFMVIHCAIEVTFSVYFFLPMAYGVFVLISLCCGEAIPKPKLSGKVRAISLAGILVLIIAYAALLVCNLMAKSIAEKEQTFDAMEEAAALDRFEWADYALSYVVNAPDAGNKEILECADAYAQRLEKLDSDTTTIRLAEYYFRTDQVKEAVEMVEKYVGHVSAGAENWAQAFHLMEIYEQDSEEYRSGVRHLAEMLEERNQKSKEQIEIDDIAKALITRAGA